MQRLFRQPVRVPAGSVLLNALLFQVGWFSCVLGGDLLAVVITATILLVHSQWLMRSSREWLLIALVAVIGISLDSFWSYNGLLQFPGVALGIPLWLACIWLLFATCLCHSFNWLQQRLLLASLLGAVAGPSSYLAGAAMADVVLGEPQLFSIALMALAWAFMFPLLLKFAQVITGD